MRRSILARDERDGPLPSANCVPSGGVGVVVMSTLRGTASKRGKPRLSLHTALLWFGPPALLCGGALALFVIARRRNRRGPDGQVKPEGGDLTAAEQARLAELLK